MGRNASYRTPARIRYRRSIRQAIRNWRAFRQEKCRSVLLPRIKDEELSRGDGLFRVEDCSSRVDHARDADNGEDFLLSDAFLPQNLFMRRNTDSTAIDGGNGRRPELEID